MCCNPNDAVYCYLTALWFDPTWLLRCYPVYFLIQPGCCIISPPNVCMCVRVYVCFSNMIPVKSLPICKYSMCVVIVKRAHPDSGQCKANPGTIYTPPCISRSNNFFSSSVVEAYWNNKRRTDSGLAPSQWKIQLKSNAVSHWLGANCDSALNKTRKCNLKSITYKLDHGVFSYAGPFKEIGHIAISEKRNDLPIASNQLFGLFSYDGSVMHQQAYRCSAQIGANSSLTQPYLL